jgi:MFS transporter, DHA1 family, multidrug resistance protein
VSTLLWATRGIVLVAFLDLFMQFPVIALYARDLGASSALVGVIVATYSASNLAGNLIAGVILDRWGRIKPLLFGLLTTAVALAGYALSRTPEQLIAARALHGLAAAVLTPGSFTVLGDSVPAGQRARAMGLSGAFIAVAAIIGPFVAGAVRDRFGVQAVFLLMSAVMFVAFLFFSLVSGRLSVASNQADLSAESLRVSRAPFSQVPRIVVGYLAAFALTIGLGTLVVRLPVLMVERGESVSRTGLAFTAFAVAAMAAMASPMSRMSDRIGRLVPIVAGLVWVSAGMFTLWASRGFVGSMLGMGLFGLGFGILFPAMAALTAESVHRRQRGRAFGGFYAVFSVGVVIGSIVSGLLAGRLGESTVLPYLVSALIALGMAVTVGFLWRLGHRPTGE